jgi:hypothetical protein
MPKEYEKTSRLVKKYLKKGYSKDTIRKSFLKSGYKREIIDAILVGTRNSSPESLKLSYILLILIPIVIIILLIVLWPTSSCKDDLDCFIEKAINCEKANAYSMIEGNTITYKAKDCKLTKEITEFDQNEPAELVLLLEDKEMTCIYEENQFDESYLSLTGNIERCDGPLKDTLINIRLAQLELEELE